LPYLCPKDEDFCGFLANMYSTTDWESFNQMEIDFPPVQNVAEDSPTEDE
jgi:hypothetical protein